MRSKAIVARSRSSMKGKSHNRSRSGTLRKIRRGQAKKKREIREQAVKGYDKQAYDKPASEEI
jgi:hypothetical protein